MKKFALFIISICAALSANARLTAFGDPATYGIKELGSGTPFDINPYTWDVFASMDAAKMFGVDDEHSTLLSAEYHSTYVQEGMKTGENSFVVSLSDRGAFFGGDGYFELAAAMPAESRYAQQYYFLGGWKYNLNDYIHIDLGGNFKYTSKRVSGPGLPGGGITFSGDIYVGLIADVPLTPFVYYMYNPDYDAQKIMAGINPQFSLEEAFAIKNLFLDMEAYYGYVHANRWTGDNKVGGRYWENSYGFVQTEVAIVYIYEGWRFSVGGGYAYQNDGEGPGGMGSGPAHNAWFSTSVGIFF